MELDAAQCYRAVSSRDPRFDGRFFTGVTSTGIYCRPVCPARTPLRKHCVFFAHAAQAAAAGFRPCRRCRPETAPGTPAWRGTSTTVSRALALIGDGFLDGGSVPRLADHLGVGDRHLRRLFRTHLGVSPLQVASTRRVHLGRQLLRDTSLSVAQIAESVGFGSERRFRDAIQKAFRQSPREVRQGADSTFSPPMSLQLSLTYRPPLDWSASLDFLRRREVAEIERVEPHSYTRVIAAGAEPGLARLQAAIANRVLVLSLPAHAALAVTELVDGFRRHFDLSADPSAIADSLGRDPLLRRLLQGRSLPRILGGFDPFEMVVRAIVGQQVSVEAATTVTRRLVRRCGVRVAEGSELSHLFPTAQAVATADLSGLGLGGRRAQTLRLAARTTLDHPEWLRLGPDLDTRLRQWRSVPGIGDWTAQIIALRALRDPDAFPAADLGLRKALGSPDVLASASRVRDRAQNWSPFRGYATVLLWSNPSVPIPHTRSERCPKPATA